MQEQKKNRLALTAIFDCVRYCGMQGIALRGHGDEKKSGNLWNLLWIIGRYNADINSYMTSQSSIRFLSPEIQNEMLTILSLMVSRKIIAIVKLESQIFFTPADGITNSYVFSLIADETSDISNKEQVSICIRYCSNSFISGEVFFGFFETCKTDSTTLFNLIKDGLLRLGLDISGLRGQGYDGGSNMAGKVNGVQQKMLNENSKALYFHCVGHQLNLVCQDACNEFPLVSQVIKNVNKIVTFVKESPKRCSWFSNIQASSEEASTVKLRPLCTTRWVLRKNCIDAFLENYNNLMNLMEEMSEDSTITGVVRSSAFTHLLNLEKFDLYYILRLLQRLFSIIHPIHVKSQSRRATTGDLDSWIQELAGALTLNLTNFGKELFDECKMQATLMKIDLPKIPGVRRTCSAEEVEEFFVKLFKQVFEAAANSLLRRYQSRSLQMSNFLRGLLEDPSMSRDEMEAVSNFYGDWNFADIVRERQLLFARFRRLNLRISVAEIGKEMSKNPALVDMAPNFISALKTYLVLPSSVCEAERSFSTLRRLKTYLRSTQTQKRLNGLAILNTHRDRAEALDLAEAVDEFVSRTQIRRNKFGSSSEL